MRRAVIIIMLIGFILNVYASDGNVKIKDGVKKIVFVKDDDGEFFKAVADLIKNLLEKKGYNQSNSQYIVLSLEGKAEKSSKIVKQIVEIKPDVVLMNTTLIKDIGINLKKYNINCVAGGGVEMEDKNGKMIFVDKNGYPTSNITGVYTMPRNHIENSIRFLSNVVDLKGKKIVFATLPSATFSKKKVESAAKAAGVELKEYKEFTNIEDYKEFVKKYNKDKEIGGIISGEPISRKKDGSKFSMEEFFKWERENNKKPSFGFWEDLVSKSKLCGLAIDAMTTVNQLVTMADRLLKGEDIKRVKPENPAKLLIIINKKFADDIGVTVPIDIMAGAWKIYIDYEGKYIEPR